MSDQVHEEATTGGQGRGSRVSDGYRQIQFHVPNEMAEILEAAGQEMNGQRINQVAVLLITEDAVEELLGRWRQVFGGGSSNGTSGSIG